MSLHHNSHCLVKGACGSIAESENHMQVAESCNFSDPLAEVVEVRHLLGLGQGYSQLPAAAVGCKRSFSGWLQTQRRHASS